MCETCMSTENRSVEARRKTSYEEFLKCLRYILHIWMCSRWCCSDLEQVYICSSERPRFGYSELEFESAAAFQIRNRPSPQHGVKKRCDVAKKSWSCSWCFWQLRPMLPWAKTLHPSCCKKLPAVAFLWSVSLPGLDMAQKPLEFRQFVGQCLGARRVLPKNLWLPPSKSLHLRYCP